MKGIRLPRGIKGVPSQGRVSTPSPQMKPPLPRSGVVKAKMGDYKPSPKLRPKLTRSQFEAPNGMPPQVLASMHGTYSNSQFQELIPKQTPVSVGDDDQVWSPDLLAKEGQSGEAPLDGLVTVDDAFGGDDEVWDSDLLAKEGQSDEAPPGGSVALEDVVADDDVAAKSDAPESGKSGSNGWWWPFSWLFGGGDDDEDSGSESEDEDEEQPDTREEAIKILETYDVGTYGYSLSGVYRSFHNAFPAAVAGNGAGLVTLLKAEEKFLGTPIADDDKQRKADTDYWAQREAAAFEASTDQRTREFGALLSSENRSKLFDWWLWIGQYVPEEWKTPPKK